MDPIEQQPISTRTRLQQSKKEKSSESSEEIEANMVQVNDGMEETTTTEQQNTNMPTQRDQKLLLSRDISSEQLQKFFNDELEKKQQIIEEQQRILNQLQLHLQTITMSQQRGGSSQWNDDEENLKNNGQPTSTMEIGRTTIWKPAENNLSKYDNFIEQQILKEKISNIRRFAGNKYEDVDEWIQNIEHDFSSTLVSDGIKMKLIPKGLTNDAKSWFEQNKHRIASWDIFKTEIKDRFQSSLYKDEKFIQLRERKQQPKETGQQFIDAMEKLCFQVNHSMSEQEKMLHIKAGLKPSLKEKVFEKQPESMQRLRQLVKRVEDIEMMLSTNDDVENPTNRPSTSISSEPISEPDNGCYAMRSYPSQYPYRRNNYRHQHQYRHQYQQQYQQGRERPNRSFQHKNGYNQPWSEGPPNPTNACKTITHDEQKKY